MAYSCTPSAFPRAVLAEATRIAPTRRTSSDGICGDAHHLATGGDHVADARGIPHAVDISNDPPRFDAPEQARRIGWRMVAGIERRVKYLVTNFGGPDMILNLAVSPFWRQNGTYKTEHRSHLHVSFTVAAEDSTAPFFDPSEADMPLTTTDITKIVDALRPVIRDQCAVAVKNALGGYDAHGVWVDGLAAATYRKDHGLTKP